MWVKVAHRVVMVVVVAATAVVVVVVVSTLATAVAPDCIERIIKSSSNFFRILRK